MNWFRITGAIVALAGSGIFILAFLRSMPIVNASAGIGVIHITGLFFGAVLVVAGLCIAIIGGRAKKFP